MAGIPKDTPIFKDQCGYSLKVKLPYEYKSDFKGEKPKHPKNEMGKVNYLIINSQIQLKEMFK